MAKGLRSSVKKSNRAKLRSSVFGPVEDARRERLSAKLLELASRPRPTITEDAEMDIEDKAQNTESKANDVDEPRAEVMDVDGRSDAANTKSNNPNRVQKKRRNKSRASIVFPLYKNRKRIGPPKKQKR
ncbi:MAG: hypothetical protein M1830_003398 [Pleopsidium flavum]|nr:MAG: hypothetical protein M1830_003398 [Pleopsidium flavum]